MIDYIRPYLLDQMTLENTAFLYTAESVGAIVGSFAMAGLCVRFGVKKSLVWVTLLNGVASLINIHVVGFVPWLMMRFLIGLALGGYFVGAVGVLMILVEMRYRGRLASFYECCFAVSLILLGVIVSVVTQHSWPALIEFGAIPPILLGGLMWLVMPNDRQFAPLPHKRSPTIQKQGIQWFLQHRRYLRFAVACIVLSGCNLFAYQFFAAYLTTYSNHVLHLSNTQMGHIITAQGIGSLVGGLFWGVVSDYWGRKVPLLGFVVAALAIWVFFNVASHDGLLLITVAVYGFMVSCTYCWGVYFAELFPERLRMLGASFYHGGRILSFLAPVLLVQMLPRYGLAVSMATGSSIALILGAVIWFSLPETLRTRIESTIRSNQYGDANREPVQDIKGEII